MSSYLDVSGCSNPTRRSSEMLFRVGVRSTYTTFLEISPEAGNSFSRDPLTAILRPPYGSIAERSPRVVFGDDTGLEPDVTVAMEADLANRFLARQS